jgi:hypothetical protein
MAVRFLKLGKFMRQFILTASSGRSLIGVFATSRWQIASVLDIQFESDAMLGIGSNPGRNSHR